MTLQDFKLKMISELSLIYEIDELNSIFNLLAEDYLKIPRSKILLADEIDLNESNQTLFLTALERFCGNSGVPLAVSLQTVAYPYPFV